MFETTARLGFGVTGRLAEVAGSNAVIVFFAISGFLLYRPFVAARAAGRPPPRAARYARRRALRILPAYWTILTVLGVFPGIVGVMTGDWWRYYGYLQLYSNRTLTGGIPVAWTLCVEVTYYLALPVWASGVGRLGTVTDARLGARRGLIASELAPLVLFAGASALIALAAERGHLPHLVGVSLAGQFTWIAVGMGIAVISVADRRDGFAARPLAWVGARAELCWAGAVAAFAGLAALVPAGGLFGLIAAVGRRNRC